MSRLKICEQGGKKSEKNKRACSSIRDFRVSKFGYSRLQEHECRMMARGKPVQPVVGAGFCPGHWDF